MGEIMSAEDIRQALMRAYKDWEYHQANTKHEFKKAEYLWNQYVYYRDLWRGCHVDYPTVQEATAN
jgi:hypothetical protein